MLGLLFATLRRCSLRRPQSWVQNRLRSFCKQCRHNSGDIFSSVERLNAEDISMLLTGVAAPLSRSPFRSHGGPSSPL